MIEGGWARLMGFSQKGCMAFETWALSIILKGDNLRLASRVGPTRQIALFTFLPIYLFAPRNVRIHLTYSGPTTSL